ncbi:MAG TPA: ABC transporter substrate-binding protein [Vicinamibacterales bacterium]|nr:ABC transporter substrate-binding protein [Vicinamibacterales bacterium]
MTNPVQGVSQIVQNITTEGLIRVTPSGQTEPQLADTWVLSPDGRALTVTLKPHLKFSDGSPIDAAIVAKTLPALVSDFLGPRLAAGLLAKPIDGNSIELDLPYPSRFWVESLEVPIRKPGASTSIGPFARDPASATRLIATDDYYLGRSIIDQIEYKPFPSVRAAWAELLRNNVDMLYEVGPDALDSLESSTTVTVFTFLRPYQYNVSFNTSAGPLRAAVVRQALNYAIDRNQLVRVALNGHGVASTGPFRSSVAPTDAFTYDPQRAAKLLNGQKIRFTCLLLTDAVYERIALEIKRQLAAIGVEMDLKSLPPDELFAAERAHNYEAFLHETLVGQSMVRLYLVWHSKGPANVVGRGTATVDEALDRVRRAVSNEEYGTAVAGVQSAFWQDPPAILLAWSERARAVSRRFVVPMTEPGDPILTLRQWKPRNDDHVASRN